MKNKRFNRKKQMQGLKTKNKTIAKLYSSHNKFNPVKIEERIFDSPLTKKEKEFLKTFDI